MSVLLACALIFGQWLGATAADPTASISRDPSGNIVETDTAGDPGAVTTTRAIYDAKTLVLLHAQSSCDCNGTPVTTTIVHVNGGNYSIESKTGGASPKNTRVDVQVPDGDLLVTGNELLVPMMAARLHVTEIVSVANDRVDLVPEQVAAASADRPADVPASDAVISIRPPRDRNSHEVRYLWYNPCTYRVDGIDDSTMTITD